MTRRQKTLWATTIVLAKIHCKGKGKGKGNSSRPLLDQTLCEHSNRENRKLRWLGTVLGRTECANFFVKTYCLWHKHLENEIILGGHRARIFQKMGPNIGIFDLVKSMESMGKR